MPTETYSSRNRHRWRVVLGGVAGTLFLFLLPAQALEQLPDLCLVRRISGQRCPGCGMAHAFHALVHGDWRSACNDNWRIVIVVPLLIGLYWREVVRLLYHETRIAP